jgi:hypothetical protein
MTMSHSDVLRPNVLPPIRLTTGLVVPVLQSPVHPPLQIPDKELHARFDNPCLNQCVVPALPCSYPPRRSKTTKRLATSQRSRHRSTGSSRTSPEMPTTSSLLTLALALSACSAQDTMPVKSCLGQLDGTPCTVEIKTDPRAGTEAKVGVATGQCYALVPGTQEAGFVSLSRFVEECVAGKRLWMIEYTDLTFSFLRS